MTRSRLLSPLALAAAIGTALAACSNAGPPPSDSTQGTAVAEKAPDATLSAPAGGYAPGTGPNPTLPAPEKSLVPTVDISPAVGWPQDGKPSPGAGFAVTAFAKDFDHPRTLYTLPNGDILVTETNAPPKPEDNQGIKGVAMKAVMKKAGAGVQSANRITLLRDRDGDGVAETRTVFMKDLMSPFGMSLVGDTFYVANADAVVKVPYVADATEITAAPVKVADLPGGPLNHHWTKALIASADGKTLYVGVGSNSNVGENGMEMETNRAAVLAIDVATGSSRVFASGLRNPTAFAWNPQSKALWTVVNERDELGNDLVPDYLTSVQEGAFYGWPYSYYGQNVDERIQPQKPELVAKAIAPDYALGSHVAALGVVFDTGAALPAEYKNGAFVSLHGSWNRKPQSGYKVVFVPFTDGRPSGPMRDVLGGFVNGKGEAQGRPVGLTLDKSGAVLVADDVGNVVWRITPAAAKAVAAR